MTRLGDYQFVSTSLSGLADGRNRLDRATASPGRGLGADLPVPGPENYLRWAWTSQTSMTSRSTSIPTFNGEWKASRGLVVLLPVRRWTIKVPLGYSRLVPPGPLLAAFLGGLRAKAATCRLGATNLTVLALAAGVLVLARSSRCPDRLQPPPALRFADSSSPYTSFVWMSKAAKAVGREEPRGGVADRRGRGLALRRGAACWSTRTACPTSTNWSAARPTARRLPAQQQQHRLGPGRFLLRATG